MDTKQPHAVNKADLTYGDYLKIEEIISLQKPLSEPAHHDEMLFIVIHQAYELWFKLLIHEMTTSMDYMKQGKVLRAHHFVNRSVEIMRLLVKQIDLLKTMAPVEFLQFRDRLMPASGFQSLQFRELEFMAGLKNKAYFRFFKNKPEFIAKLEKRLAEPDLRHAYYGMLSKLGYQLPDKPEELAPAQDGKEDGSEGDYEKLLDALLPIYQDPEKNLELNLLTESLIDFDEALYRWRVNHMRVVERIVGMKMGTGGSSGVQYLATTVGKKCFPALWDLRTRLKV